MLINIVVICGLAGVGVFASASPASAHTVGGNQATNYRTQLHGMSPHISGITIRSVNLGGKLELRNDTQNEVVVFGYQNDPYLRVGPTGVYENERSPAVALNRSSIPSASISSGTYDPNTQPVWHKLSDQPIARWHDHRAHWMGIGNPPVVQHDLGHTHVVIHNWQIPLTVADHPASISGDVLWIPGPSPWLWLFSALCIGVIVIALAQTRFWGWLFAFVLIALLGIGIVDAISTWQFSVTTIFSKLENIVWLLVACLAALFAVIWLCVRGSRSATPVVLLAGIYILSATGFARITMLWHSQIATTLSSSTARLLVSIALGLGIGLVIASGFKLRSPSSVSLEDPEILQSSYA